jgi:hypothetical protein
MLHAAGIGNLLQGGLSRFLSMQLAWQLVHAAAGMGKLLQGG